MAEHFVRAVGGPDHGGIEVDGVSGAFVHTIQVGDEVFAQCGELAVGVSVESCEVIIDGGAHAIDDDARKRIGVLVDVELDRHIEVRSPVWLEADEV